MNKDAEEYLGREYILKAQKEIERQFVLSEPEAYDMAVKALYALDAHGGAVRDWQQVKATIDVVVKSWLEMS